ncbi:MAG: hypothetical protein ABL857_07375 [Rickettsiales bacterium]
MADYTQGGMILYDKNRLAPKEVGGASIINEKLPIQAKELGKFEKIVRNFKGHWNNSEGKTFGKVRVGIGAILIPAALAASAASDVFGEKKKDESGQEIDRSVIMPLVKSAAALGIAALALRGGAGKLSKTL